MQALRAYIFNIKEIKITYLLYFIFTLTVLGFLGYNTLLKDFILKAFLDTNDNYDIQYYTKIFQYLNYPFAGVIILLGLVIIFKQSLICWSKTYIEE